MLLHPRALAAFVFVAMASLQLFASRRPDLPPSKNGSFSNCPKGPSCPVISQEGEPVILSGTDHEGNTVTVTITVYNWGSYPCSTKCSPTPRFYESVIDVTLTGTDTVGIQSVVIKSALPNPAYVSCGGSNTEDGGIACVNAPAPDGENVQEPTPISAADQQASVNTRWDFGGVPPSSPPLPAIPFDQLQCLGHDAGGDTICDSTPLGEAILTISKPNLSTSSSDYSVTLTDGTVLGSFVVPAPPTKIAPNNTQATATVISKLPFKDYTDTSQAYPGINADGSMNYPSGFVQAPIPNPPSSFPSCYPTNGVTGTTDPRTFRTVWYTYTPSSTGYLSINTGGSRYDTLIAVFAGSPSSATTVACNDDTPTGFLQAGVTFHATQLTQYWIVVYQTPTIQTTNPGSLTGYPLSADGSLHLSVTFSANAPTTTTRLSALPGTSNPGQPVQFTATVTSTSPGVPTGTVTFSQGGTVLGSSTLNGTKATFSTSSLPVGTDAIKASYSGDSIYVGSSATLNYDVK